MLKTYLNTIPCTKFVLLTDSLEDRDTRISNYILQHHINQKQNIQYCVFEGVFNKIEAKYKSTSNVHLHNFVCRVDNDNGEELLERTILKSSINDVIVFDSMANVVFKYGLQYTLRTINALKNNKAVKQIFAILHKDLMLGNFHDAILYVSNLSTLHVDIQPKFLNTQSRIRYQYKKSGGRIITEIEEYEFEGPELKTNKIAKLDPNKLLEKSCSNEIKPDDLTTFKISLTEEEKEARDKVILPYLPVAIQEPGEEGKFFYKFDEADDWDEEDPDDDLDI